MSVKVNAEIRDSLEMIQVCKQLIGAVNDVAVRMPNLSELCAEVIASNRDVIQDYVKRIRQIKAGA